MSNDTLKKFFLLVISVLAGIILVWKSDDSNISLPDNKAYQEEPDFFVVNGLYTLFNEHGKISSKLKSKEAKHYPDRNIAVLSQPHLLVYREDDTHWKLTADFGEYDLTKEQVKLTRNVVITRDEQLTTPWTLKTESLTLFNKTRFITTKQPVTISDSVNIINGTGMNGWIDNKKIELTSRVRGNYVVQ